MCISEILKRGQGILWGHSKLIRVLQCASHFKKERQYWVSFWQTVLDSGRRWSAVPTSCCIAFADAPPWWSWDFGHRSDRNSGPWTSTAEQKTRMAASTLIPKPEAWSSPGAHIPSGRNGHCKSKVKLRFVLSLHVHCFSKWLPSS